MSLNGRIDVEIRVIREEIYTYGLPQYATEGSAGVDLYACIDETITLQPNQRIVIPAGISIHMKDTGVAAFIFARSGWATKRGIALSNGVGVVDSDYTDEIGVGLINLDKDPVTIEPGDRIAQMVFMPVYQAHWLQVSKHDNTNRQGGFGSTGN